MLLTEIDQIDIEIEYERIEGEGYMQLINRNVEHYTESSILPIKQLTSKYLYYTKEPLYLCNCISV